MAIAHVNYAKLVLKNCRFLLTRPVGPRQDHLARRRSRPAEVQEGASLGRFPNWGDAMAERPSWIEIDLQALAHNHRQLQHLAGPGRRVIASIKANAYGHGALDIARVLEACGAFGLWTGHVPEALALRRAGIRAPIFLFGGYLPQDIPELLRHDLIPTICDAEGLAAAASSGQSAAPVIVKVDSGLGRLGVSLAEAGPLIRSIVRTDGVRLAGIYTHLPFHDRCGLEWAAACAAKFEGLLTELHHEGIAPEISQLWGSSGLIAGLADGTNAVCVGHLLYGLLPLEAGLGRPLDLRSVCTGIKSRLIHIGRHPPGADLAIAGRYRSAGASVVGVLPLGLGDGMTALRTGTAPVALVRGARAPIIGVSLEHMVLDLAAVPRAAIGDEVALVGDSREAMITLAECAATLARTPLELLMGFSGRLAVRIASPFGTRSPPTHSGAAETIGP